MAVKENTLWVEKYRPRKLERYVGNEHLKDKVAQYIAENDPPHLLFYGRAGTGKTTLAKIIASNTDSDTIYMNASDETGVDVVRDKIKPFASTVSFGSLKLVILDEFEYMSDNAQATLRNLMEQYSKLTRFILTCNFADKIIDPIKSRCQQFEIVPPSREKVAVRVANILQAEKITFDPENVKLLVDSHYPDIRQIINDAQRFSVDGELAIDKYKFIEGDFRLSLLEILKVENDTQSKKDKAFAQIRQTVYDNNVASYTDIFRFLYDCIDDFADNLSKAILVLADGIRNDKEVADKEINFMATIINLLSVKDA